MATIKKPIRIGDDTPLRNFQTGEAVGPDHGGTGLTNTELAGNVGKFLAVNATADGYTLTPGSGGGGGVESVTGPGVDNTDAANPVVSARPYKVYTALLSQSGEDAPTVIVLENTLSGDVVWTREGAGIYNGTLADAFTINKSCTNMQNFILTINGGDQQVFLSIRPNSGDDDYVVMQTFDTSLNYVDANITDALVEIRVYP